MCNITYAILHISYYICHILQLGLSLKEGVLGLMKFFQRQKLVIYR